MSRPLYPRVATAPILVTGMARSGTTWVGKVLAAGSGIAYLEEPMNLDRTVGIVGAGLRRWHTYITWENEQEYLASFERLLAFRNPLLPELHAARSRADVVHALKARTYSLSQRLRASRPLVKDPHAIFSAEWFARRFAADVVVTIRHPAAVASSWKRLGWTFDFEQLLGQPLLMRDLLEPFRSAIEEAARGPADPVDHAAILWRAIYGVVAGFTESVPSLVIVRHEDLAGAPLDRFADLHRRLSLHFGERSRRAVLETTSSENPREAAVDDPYSIKLDSRRNVAAWRGRLEAAEIQRVREATADVAAPFYGDADLN
jgi:hypothetical protein